MFSQLDTLLPWDDYRMCAAVMPATEILNQVKNAVTILGTLHQSHARYREIEDDPAVLMWIGCEVHLAHYGTILLEEYNLRGDSAGPEGELYAKLQYHADMALTENPECMNAPFWMGDEELHRSYRSKMLRDNQHWYAGKFEKDLPIDLPFTFPRAGGNV